MRGRYVVKNGNFYFLVCFRQVLFQSLRQMRDSLVPSTIKNTESFITEILAVDQKTNVILGSATGFFVENKINEDLITLATVFHSFNLLSLMSESVFFFLIKYQGRFVSMKEVTASFFPLQDLVFIHFQKSTLAQSQGSFPNLYRSVSLVLKRRMNWLIWWDMLI